MRIGLVLLLSTALLSGCASFKTDSAISNGDPSSAPQRQNTESARFSGMVVAIEEALGRTNDPMARLRFRVNLAIDRGEIGSLLKSAEADYVARRDIPSGELLILCLQRTRCMDKAVEIRRQLMNAAPSDLQQKERYALDLDLALRFDEAAGICRQLADSIPARRSELLLRAAGSWQAANDYAEAERDISSALAAAPEKTAIAIFKAAAQLHSRMGNDRKSLAVYQAALKQYPADPDLNCEAATLHALYGKRDQWLACNIAAIGNTSGFAARKTMLRYLQEHPHSKQLMEALTAEVAAKPQSRPLLSALALLQAFSGDEVAAIETAEKGLAADPRNPDLLLTMAAIHQCCGEYRKGIDLCEELLQQPEVTRDEVLDLLGELYSDCNRTQEAYSARAGIADPARRIKALSRSGLTAETCFDMIAANPLDSSNYRLAGDILHELKDPDAEDVMRCELLLDPDSRNTISHLGEIYLRAEDRNKLLATGLRMLNSRPCTLTVTDDNRDPSNILYHIKKAVYDGATDRNPFAASRAYYEDNGLLPEFTAILAGEIPACRSDPVRALDLLTVLEDTGDHQRAADVIRIILGTPDLELERHPYYKGSSAGDIREDLIGRLINVCNGEDLREKVIAGYKAEFQKQSGLRFDYDYLVYSTLLAVNMDTNGAIDVLDAGIRQIPDNIQLKWARAVLLPDRAASALALDALKERWPVHNVAPVELAAIDRQQRNIIYGLPPQQAAIITESDRKLIRNSLTLKPQAPEPGVRLLLTRMPSLSTFSCVLAGAHYAAGDKDKARGILKSLLPADPCIPADWSAFAAVARLAGDEDTEREILKTAIAHRAAARDSLSLFLHKNISPEITGRGNREDPVAERLAALCLKAREYVGSYDILRSSKTESPDYPADENASTQLFAIMQKYGIGTNLVDFYTAHLNTATREFNNFRDAAKQKTSPAGQFQLRRLRNAALEEGYKLAEVHQFLTRFKDAAAVYRQLLELEPRDGAVLGCLRILAMKEQDFESAIRHQEAILTLYCGKRPDPEDEADEIYPDLAPFNPKSDRDDWDDSESWGYHSYSTLYRNPDDGRMYGAVTEEMGRYSSIFLKAGKKLEGVRAIDSFCRKNSIDPEREYSILNSFGITCGITSEIIPLLSELMAKKPHDYRSRLSHLSFLIDQKRINEAVDSGLTLRDELPAWPAYRQERKNLNELLVKLGRLAKRKLADDQDSAPKGIRSAAMSDPDDLPAQIRFLQLLWAEGKLDEALALTENIRATHKEDADNERYRSLILRQLGKDALWLSEQENMLARQTKRDRTSTLPQLIMYHNEHGNTGEAAGLAERLIVPDDGSTHMAALGWLETLGCYDRMPAILEQLVGVDTYPSRLSYIKNIRMAVLLRLGKDSAAVSLLKDALHPMASYQVDTLKDNAAPCWESFRQEGRLDLLSTTIEQLAGKATNALHAARLRCAYAAYLGRKDKERELKKAICSMAPDTPEALLWTCEFMNEDGNLAGLESVLRKQLTKTPDDSSVIEDLALLQLRMGRTNEARQTLMQIFKESDPESALYAATILNGHGFTIEAQTMLYRYLKAEPMMTQEQYDRAIELLKAAGNLNKAFAMAAERHDLYMRAKPQTLIETRGQEPHSFDSTFFSLACKAGKTELYLKTLKSIAEADSNRVAPQLELAEAYSRLGRDDDYRALLRGLVQTFPRNNQIRGRLLRCYELDEDWQQCVELLRDQLEKVPGSQNHVKAKLARCFEYQNQTAGAERLFSAIVTNSSDASNYSWLARWQLGIGRPDNAMRTLELGMQAVDDRQLKMDYAIVLATLNHTNEAIRAYHDAIRENGLELFNADGEAISQCGACNLRHHGNQYWHRAGKTVSMLKRLYRDSTFIQDTERALTDKPDDPASLENMLIIADVRGDAESALILSRRLLELEPYNPRRISAHCHRLEHAGRYADTLPYYERALQITGDGSRHQPLPSRDDVLELLTAIRFAIDRDDKRATSQWRRSFGPHEYHRNNGQLKAFLLNQGLPQAVVDLPPGNLIPSDARNPAPAATKDIDFLYAIALLETGRTGELENYFATHAVCPAVRPKLYRQADDYSGAYLDTKEVLEFSLDESGRAFHEACVRAGCADRIVESLRKTFAAQKGASLQPALLALAEYHYDQTKQPERAEEITRNYRTPQNPTERLALAKARANAAVERKDISRAISILSECLSGSDAATRKELMRLIAWLHEFAANDLEKALAVYRDLSVPDATPIPETSESERDNYQPDDRLRSWNVEDRAPGFFSHPSLNTGDGSSEFAIRPLQFPSAGVRTLLARAFAERGHILRLLLKLKRTEAANALENEILAFSPQNLPPSTPAKEIQLWLREQLAEAHLEAGNYDSAIRHSEEAYLLETQLITAAVKTPAHREAALLACTQTHLDTLMDTALKAGQPEKYSSTFNRWKTCLKNQVRYQDPDCVTLSMLARLIDVPDGFVRQENLIEAERLINTLADPSSVSARLLSAAISLRRGRTADALSTCETVIARFDNSAERWKLTQRYHGDSQRLLNYGVRDNPMDRMTTGELLLIAKIADAAGNSTIKERTLKQAEMEDPHHSHFRWSELKPK